MIGFETVSLARAVLTLQLLSQSIVLIQVVPPPPQVLIVIEDGGAYGLFGPFLANDVLVDAGLEIAGVELWDPKRRVREHGPAVGNRLGGVIGTGEARVEVLWSPRGAERRGDRKGPISRAL